MSAQPLKILIIALFFMASAAPFSAVAAAEPTAEASQQWWNAPYPERFDKASLKPQPLIRVVGNHFEDDQGSTVIFRGVNIADPDKLVRQQQWGEALFDELSRNWAVDTVRLPVHPTAWRQVGKEAYLALLDDAVRWANARGMYLILDWHSIGYLPTEQYQHPMYDTTIKETRDFWRTVSFRYQGIPTIAIYELFNEPTTQGETLGKRNWAEWKRLNESLIDMICAADETAIPLVAGFNWAYDLSYIKRKPIDRDGIAYAVHPYPQKAKVSEETDAAYFKEWDKIWGFATKNYPVIATELGWVQPDGYGAHVPVKNDGSYGPRIVRYMQEHGVSYTVWVFDPDWSPTMIDDWNFTPSEQGAFFKNVLQQARTANSPADPN